MLTITTDRGAKFTAKYALNTKQAPNKLVLSIEDTRKTAEIAAELEGCEQIRAVDDAMPGMTQLFEGFTLLDAVQRLSGGAYRVTLYKGE